MSFILLTDCMKQLLVSRYIMVCISRTEFKLIFNSCAILNYFFLAGILKFVHARLLSIYCCLKIQDSLWICENERTKYPEFKEFKSN